MATFIAQLYYFHNTQSIIKTTNTLWLLITFRIMNHIIWCGWRLIWLTILRSFHMRGFQCWIGPRDCRQPLMSQFPLRLISRIRKLCWLRLWIHWRWQCSFPSLDWSGIFGERFQQHEIKCKEPILIITYELFEGNLSISILVKSEEVPKDIVLFLSTDFS